MRNPKRLLLTMITLSSLTQPTSHATPLKMETLKTNQWEFGFDVSYINLASERADILEEVVQVGNNFVVVPRAINTTTTNLDTAVFVPSISYGFTERTIFFANLAYVSNNRRSTSASDKTKETDAYLSEIFAGVQYHWPFSERVGLDVAGHISLAEANTISGNEVNFDLAKSYGLILIGYKQVEPLILSFEIRYKSTLEREIDDIPYNPPDILSMAPDVKFSINQEVVLNGGFVWTRIGESEVNGMPTLDIYRTKTDLTFGLDYRLSNRWRLISSIQANVSGEGGANITFGLRYH